MVSRQVVEQQLKELGFSQTWGKAEIRELPHIMLPDEKISECVNGYYEGGFALLVATNLRVLLIDKKPLNYLTVEDLRFDMINEIDYSHRLMGAHITIATGSKNLKFRSYNQPRLRKLINHVQHCMAEAKLKQSEHQEGQNQHLEQINQQLQAYLMAQQQHQEQLQQQLEDARASTPTAQQPTIAAEAVKPDPQLSDYLFSQSLLAQYRAQQAQPAAQSQGQPQDQNQTTPAPQSVPAATSQPPPSVTAPPSDPANSQLAELYAEGLKEIFDKRQPTIATSQPDKREQLRVAQTVNSTLSRNPLEINALRIAYSKLPMALRNRRFGRPSFHAHSQSQAQAPTIPTQSQPIAAQ